MKNLPISRKMYIYHKKEHHILGFVHLQQSRFSPPPFLLPTWKTVRALYSRWILGTRERKMQSRKMLALGIR